MPISRFVFYSYHLKAEDPETGRASSKDKLLSEASVLIAAGMGKVSLRRPPCRRVDS